MPEEHDCISGKFAPLTPIPVNSVFVYLASSALNVEAQHHEKASFLPLRNSSMNRHDSIILTPCTLY
jgi:hypothetical protein